MRREDFVLHLFFPASLFHPQWIVAYINRVFAHLFHLSYPDTQEWPLDWRKILIKWLWLEILKYLWSRTQVELMTGPAVGFLWLGLFGPTVGFLWPEIWFFSLIFNLLIHRKSIHFLFWVDLLNLGLWDLGLLNLRQYVLFSSSNISQTFHRLTVNFRQTFRRLTVKFDCIFPSFSDSLSPKQFSIHSYQTAPYLTNVNLPDVLI